MTPAPLLDYIANAHARRSDPQTSHEAAEQAKSLYHSHITRILHALSSGRPMAAEEISDALGFMSEPVCMQMDKVMVGKRLKDMERLGLIVRTDERHINRSGRTAFKVRLA